MQVTLKNVRFNYLATLKPREFEGSEGEAKFSATLLLEKDSEEAKQVDAAMEAVAQRNDALRIQRLDDPFQPR